MWLKERIGINEGFKKFSTICRWSSAFVVNSCTRFTCPRGTCRPLAIAYTPLSWQMKHYTSVLAAPWRKCEARYYRLPSSVTVNFSSFFLKTAAYFCAIFISAVADSWVTSFSLAARIIFSDFNRDVHVLSELQWRHIGLLAKTQFL